MRVGFAFSVWDDGGMFRILERGTLQWPEVKDILVHYYTDSPADITSALQVDPPTRDSSVLVSWRNRTTSTADLIIERARATGEAFTVVATLPAGSDRYVDTNLVGGGTFIYRLYTHRTDGTLLHGYPTKLFVPSGVQASFGAGPITLPGILEVELYDKGGEGLAYHDTDAINEGGSFRLEEGVDIGGGPGGALTLGYVVSGEWLEYTVDVQQAGNYIVTASTASEQANGAFRVSFEKNQAATTFTTPNTGNWNGYRNITANSLIKLDTGLQVMRLAITGTAPTNINWLRFDVQTSDLSESAASIGFLVGPNPAVDFVGITLPQNLLATRAQLSLVSMTGQVLRKLNVETQQQQLDVSALASGQYYLQLELDGTAYTQPVTVLR